MKSLMALVLVPMTMLGACGGGGGGKTNPNPDFATTEDDAGRTDYDFAQTRRTYDFASADDLANRYDLARTISTAPSDMGNPTTPPSNGTDSSGGAIASGIGSIIGGLIGSLLNNGGKNGTSVTTGGGTTQCPSGLDAYGYCYNNVAVWCDNDDDAAAEDCGAEGIVCSYDCPGYEGYAACCAPSGDVTSCYESCEGTVLTYCTGEGTQTYDCSGNSDGNTACGLDSNGYMGCVQSTGGDCDGQSVNGSTYYGVTYQGICDGNVLVYCDANSNLDSADCGSQGLDCIWVNDSVGYSCEQD